MSKTNTSVSLGLHFAGFVDRQVTEGRYGNASEVVRAGLRLLEEREAQHQALKAAIKEGLESGPSELVDLAAYAARRSSLRQGSSG